MKNLLLKVLTLSVFLGFSSASADIVQDISLEVITQVINSPTKNIVEQEIGDTVISYNKYKDYYIEIIDGEKKLAFKYEYGSYHGEIVDKGIEQDSKGRDYNFVIVYFKNGKFSGGNFHKFTQYSNRKSSLFVLSGISTVNLPVVHFRMTKDSWTKTYYINEFGGYGGKESRRYAAL